MPDVVVTPCAEAWAPEGALRFDYASPTDGMKDWGVFVPGRRTRDCVVVIHGHGSHGDQLFTRPDIRATRLPYCLRLGVSILSPNLRDNAWMGPAAAADLRTLLGWARAEFGAERFHFNSGSMGGTSNLVYAALHPEDVASAVALCPATDLRSYHAWLRDDPARPVLREIREAITASYGGPPDARPEVYAAHSAIEHADRLTMPLFIEHGDADPTIPVEQSRRLIEAMGIAPNLTYREVVKGGHDAPLKTGRSMKWFAETVGRG